MKKYISISTLILLLTVSGNGQTAPAKTQPGRLSWDPQRTWVYFVGLLEWKDGKKFGSFPQKNRRDEILLNVIRQRGVPESQVVYLKDKDATLAKVKESFPRLLQRAREGDTVIVYFCGHGFKTGDHKGTLLATYDADGKDLGWRTDTIPADIERNFKGSNAFILADNCYSGALAEDVKALPKPRVSYAVMASTHFNSFSTANWTFTESLIAGFRGEPYFDNNGDGKITLDELSSDAEQDMLFGEEQVPSFVFSGNFKANSVVALAADTRSSRRVGEHVEAYSVDGWYRGYIRDEKDGKFLIRYYGYEESDDEWVPANKVRQAKITKYPIGSHVDVNWLGKWYRGKVLDVKGGSHYITFDGFGPEWDEWTPSKRIKPLAAADETRSSMQFSVGALIEARDYRKVWYRSKVLEVGGGKYKVHYFGWTAQWDEWVTPDRVRNCNDYEFGREVEVLQNGTWYKAILIEARAGQHLIAYIGYDEDEWVNDDRIRGLDQSTWSDDRQGRIVEALSKGKWYKARILDERNGEYYIHYEGYSDSWNEWLPANKIREPR